MTGAILPLSGKTPLGTLFRGVFAFLLVNTLPVGRALSLCVIFYLYCYVYCKFLSKIDVPTSGLS